MTRPRTKSAPPCVTSRTAPTAQKVVSELQQVEDSRGLWTYATEPSYFARLDDLRWQRRNKLALFHEENGSGPLWVRGMRWSYETGLLFWKWDVWEGRSGVKVSHGRALTFRRAVWAAERAAGA